MRKNKFKITLSNQNRNKREIVIRRVNQDNLMEKTFRKNTVISTFLIASLIAASGLFLFFSSSIGTVMGIPPYLVKGDYLFGKTIGIVDDENAKPLWIVSGIWKTNLSNQTQVGDNSTIFNASFEMIKTDGTSKHTHSLTDFVLTNVANQNNNITVFNGTGTISMPKAPITEVPLSIQVINNTLGIINIDSNKMDNHFGKDPLYGIPLEDKDKQNKKKS